MTIKKAGAGFDVAEAATRLKLLKKIHYRVDEPSADMDLTEEERAQQLIAVCAECGYGENGWPCKTGRLIYTDQELGLVHLDQVLAEAIDHVQFKLDVNELEAVIASVSKALFDHGYLKEGDDGVRKAWSGQPKLPPF